jgi:hypothetical protein
MRERRISGGHVFLSWHHTRSFWQRSRAESEQSCGSLDHRTIVFIFAGKGQVGSARCAATSLEFAGWNPLGSNRVSAQSAEKCSCVGRDASKLRTQTWYGEVYERAHLRYRHAAGRRKQMYRERRIFSIGQDDF